MAVSNMNRDKPLMKNIIGQMDNKGVNHYSKGSYAIKDPFSNEPDMKSYRVDRINFKVPLRGDKLMNANIGAQLLEDEEMRDMGFLERPFHWEYRKKISFLSGMEEYLVVTIGKKRNGINIKVVDEYLDIVYDYQSVLYNDEFNEYANRIHTNVQIEIMKLVDAGIITGYKRNDYI